MTPNCLLHCYNGFYVSLDLRIAAKLRYVSNQNPRAQSTYQEPQAIHISYRGEEIRHGSDVETSRGGQIIIIHLKQLLPRIINELAKTIRYLKEVSVLIDDGTAFGARLYAQQFLAIASIGQPVARNQ